MSAPECRIIRTTGEAWGLDIVESAEFTPDVVVATKPIDPGSAGGATVIVDSTIKTGLGITVNGVVSAYPIAGAGTLTAFDRERRTIEFLDFIVGELVTVIVPRHPAFKNCLLASFPWRLDGKLRTPITLAFRQNKIASSSTIILPRVAVAKRDVVPPDDIGEQGTTVITEPKETQDVSLGVQALKKIGVLR